MSLKELLKVNKAINSNSSPNKSKIIGNLKINVLNSNILRLQNYR